MTFQSFGDGPQTVRALCNDEQVETRRFDNVTDMVAFVTDYLTVGLDHLDASDVLSVEWFDRAPEPGIQLGDPDMTATVVDGEIVWVTR